ncbi:MAG TPA: Holliday junction branch migration protein RuvA [Bryobacteraceae bacterium]|nr:Holliday junction branch migration protein RuvA [Bryobacteraceae bacterium]HPT28099.1 Holliday junction branch migration protein RuvA [Bryobacteraceae bacterium]
MIAHLRGTLIEKHPNQAVVECGGVGYDVVISVSTYGSLPDVGAEVRLRIHTHVREDALILFGFVTVEERSLFEKLITVSGIGPKMAITVLSGVEASHLITIIRGGEVQQLTRIPGIGKKTAERIVLELRDKLDFAAAAQGTSKGPAVTLLSTVEQDAVSALVNLGCQQGAAELAVKKAAGEAGTGDFEPLFRRAMELLR